MSESVADVQKTPLAGAKVTIIIGAHKGLTGIVLSRSKKDKYYWVTIGATLPSLRVELPRWYFELQSSDNNINNSSSNRLSKKNSKKLLNTSADVHNKAGSPKKVKANTSSRLNKVKVVADTDVTCSTSNEIEDNYNNEDEARNNLYWSLEYELPVIWYGQEKADIAESLVTVSPIFYHDDIEECRRLTKENRNHAGKRRNIKVNRHKLVVLDQDILLRRCKTLYDTTYHFTLALIDFAEYDDRARETYCWPEFLSELLFNSTKLTTWIKITLGDKSLVDLFDEKRRIFLFTMCVQHSFGDHPSHYPDFISNALEAPPDEPLPSCMNGILKNITCEVRYLKNEIEALTSADIDDGDFGRSSSRVGKIYQVDHKVINESISTNLQENVQTIRPDDGKVFTADIINDSDINAYLYRVQLLRARHVSAGSLLQAPYVSSTQNSSMSISSQYSIHTNNDSDNLAASDLVEAKAAEEVETVSSNTVSSNSKLKPRKKKPLIPCIALNKRSNIGVESMDPVSTDVFENIRTSIQFQELDVFDGFNEWTVPLVSCQILSLPDDRALEILHEANYDIVKALDLVQADLVIHRVTQDISWSKLDIDDFMKASHRQGPDLRQIFLRYNAIVVNNANESNVDEIIAHSSSAAAPINDDGALSNTMDIVIDDGAHGMDTDTSTANTTSRYRTFKDIMQLHLLVNCRRPYHDHCGYNNTGKVENDHKKVQNENNKRSYPAIVNKPENDSSKSKQPRKETFFSNRWPSQLKMAKHNVYWLKNSNNPCICTSLDNLNEPNPSFKIITLGITYQRETTVPMNALEALNDQNSKSCIEPKIQDVALALCDFAEWEMNLFYNTTGLNCKFYTYPDFIMSYLQHAPSFKSFRAEAERNARGKLSSRKEIYYDAFLEEYKKQYNITCASDATTLCSNNMWCGRFIEYVDNFPWDDTSFDPVDDLNVGTDNDESSSHDEEKSSRKTSKIVSEPVVPEAPKRKRSQFNLYWLFRSQLPCIYHDMRENEYSEKGFMVLPISCTSYRYPTPVPYSELKPLTVTNLKECTDERTCDFALALMGFAAYHQAHDDLLAQHKSSSTQPTDDQYYTSVADAAAINAMHDFTSRTALTDNPDSFYEWPEFIIDLLTRSKDWAIWRKKVERNVGALKIPRKMVYLKALLEDFKSSQNELA